MTPMFQVTMILVWLVFFVLWLRAEYRMRKAPVRETITPYDNWIRLPSGWTKTQGGYCGYVLPHEGRYYWCVMRMSRTLLEGQSSHLTDAMTEVESATYQLRRQ